MIRYITNSFKWFFKLEAASGLVLLFAAIIALIVSNSGISDLYFSKENIQIIQNGLRAGVYKKSNGSYVIDEQNHDELMIIMRILL